MLNSFIEILPHWTWRTLALSSQCFFDTHIFYQYFLYQYFTNIFLYTSCFCLWPKPCYIFPLIFSLFDFTGFVSISHSTSDPEASIALPDFRTGHAQRIVRSISCGKTFPRLNCLCHLCGDQLIWILTIIIILFLALAKLRRSLQSFYAILRGMSETAPS